MHTIQSLMQNTQTVHFNILLHIFTCRSAMFSRLTQGVSSVLQELSGEERSDGDVQVSRQNLNNPCGDILGQYQETLWNTHGHCNYPNNYSNLLQELKDLIIAHI